MTPIEKLHEEGLLSDLSFERIKAHQKDPGISVHWELKTILYLGVLLLSSGLGIVIYKNIDSIGHQVILVFIALLSAGGFFYCCRKKLPFSTAKAESPDSFFDYILLLACLSFITFIGYWQYQYQIFGNRFGLVTFIPMLVLFFSAYFFDHLGILSLAITNLAAWAGIAVTPTRILKENDFNSETLIVTGLLLGIALVLAGIVTLRRNIKPHFAFTYTNFGLHISFISCLAGLFHFENSYLLWFLLLIGIAGYFYREAVQKKSFYFLLVLTLYTYIGLCYIIMRLLFETANLEMGGFYLACLYFIGSGTGLILFLIRMNKKIKTA
jgi:hypothetical protein